MLTTTTNHSQDPLKNIFDLVADVPVQPEPEPSLDKLPPSIEAQAQEAAKAAYFGARAQNKSVGEAKLAAQEAFESTALALLRATGKPSPKAAEPIEWTEAPFALAKHAPVVNPIVAMDAPVQLPPAKPTPRPSPAPKPTPRPRPTPTMPNRSDERVMVDGIDVTGAARSNVDREAARAAGFAPAEPYYRVGTPVIELGVQNARKSRLEHDRLPSVREACERVIEKIAAEDRRVVEVDAVDVAMRDDGRLHFHGTDLDFDMTRPAFSGLVSRLGYGGATYLEKCKPELRALNVNTWRHYIHCREAAERDLVIARNVAGDHRAKFEPQRLAMRVRTRAADPTRNDPGGSEIFAAVSPGYTAFDADKICQAIARSSPPDAKASITYDGENARMLASIRFHSDVQPKNYVAGEFFKAAVSVRCDDTGGGSIVVSAQVFQNLCLNLICIDRAGKEIARIRHVGNVFELAKKLEAAYKKALESLHHFIAQWGYACEENVVTRAQAVAESKVPRDELALPGLFNGIMDAGLVTIPRIGTVPARKSAIDKLCDLWEGDRSSARVKPYVTRASIANAFTAFARDLEAEDPWAAEEIQREAGALLWPRSASGTEPTPLPYLDLEAEAKAPQTAARAR